MTAEYEVLEWKHQCLETQNQRMNKRKRIHDMKSDGPQGTGVFCGDDVVVI
jgi:hypothetical protein